MRKSKKKPLEGEKRGERAVLKGKNECEKRRREVSASGGAAGGCE